MHPKVGKALYLGLQDLRGIHIRSHLSWLEQTQRLPVDELRQLQWERLQRTLQHAYHHVPYYRARWKAIKLHPDQIRTPEDFQQLPILTKQDVREHAKELRADNARGRTFHRFTSGSTGVPLGIEHSANSRAAMWAAKYRGHRWNGVDVGEKTVWVRGMPANGAAYAARRVDDWLTNGVRLFPGEIVPGLVTRFHQRLQRFHPRLLEGYASALYQMAKLMQELKLDGRALGLRLVVAGGEVLYDFQRTCLQEVFGCPVADEYGCAEVGIIGFDCEHGRRHIPVENVYVETQPCTPGIRARSSELIVTSLVNDAMPFVRYRLGDLGTIETQPCRCGRAAPTVAGLDGKITGLIRTADGRWLHDSVIRNVIYQIEQHRMGVAQIRFAQEEDASVTVEIVRGEHFHSETVEHVWRSLKALLGERAVVHIRFVERIPQKDSGKFCFFVSRLPESAREAGQVVGQDRGAPLSLSGNGSAHAS